MEDTFETCCHEDQSCVKGNFTLKPNLQVLFPELCTAQILFVILNMFDTIWWVSDIKKHKTKHKTTT